MENPEILIVDDEVEFASTLAERLQLRGINTTTAGDGEEALNILENNMPDVVILDILMPGMSGLEVLQQIKKQYPEIPVILLTGHGSTRDGIDGMRLGAFDYLVKPLKIEELLEKINEAVHQKNKN